MVSWDLPGGPVAKNLPSNVGDVGFISGWEMRIPHAAGQLNVHVTTRELVCYNKKMIPHATVKTPCATSKTQGSQINNKIKYLGKKISLWHMVSPK